MEAARAIVAHGCPQAPEAGDVDAAGGGWDMRFPPSFFPLWKPPFRLPPFQADHTKGGKPQGDKGRIGVTPYI